jgi:hypothetical protein
MTDRRIDTRHEIVLAINVGGKPGVTRDVSSGGVYFSSTFEFEPGAQIEFTLPLPLLKQSGIELNCRGRVLRVDRRDHDCGIAAKIEQFTTASIY